jgi:hypothetical protein
VTSVAPRAKLTHYPRIRCAVRSEWHIQRLNRHNTRFPMRDFALANQSAAVDPNSRGGVAREVLVLPLSQTPRTG